MIIVVHQQKWFPLRERCPINYLFCTTRVRRTLLYETRPDQNKISHFPPWSHYCTKHFEKGWTDYPPNLNAQHFGGSHISCNRQAMVQLFLLTTNRNHMSAPRTPKLIKKICKAVANHLPQIMNHLYDCYATLINMASDIFDFVNDTYKTLYDLTTRQISQPVAICL